MFFLLVPIIYIGFQLLSFEQGSVYNTDTIIEQTVYDSITVNGIVSREQTQITYDGGILGFITPNAGRVSQNSVVATSFATLENAKQSAYSNLLLREIDVLLSSSVSTIGADTAILQNGVTTSANELLNAIYFNDFYNYYDIKYDLQLSLNKLNIVLENEQDYTNRISSLTQSYESALTLAAGTPVITTQSGYFVSKNESSQSVYTKEQLQQMNAQQLYDAALTSTPEHADNIVGNIIGTHIWEFYTSVPLSEVNNFTVGYNVNISFEHIGSDKYTAQIISIEEDETAGLAKIVLQCNLVNADVLSTQHTQALIEFRQINGLRISKDALRVKDAIDGVYVLRGNIIEFCEIDILYEWDNYYLVSPVYESGKNEVRLFDEAIINGTDLYDGKLL